MVIPVIHPTSLYYFLQQYVNQLLSQNKKIKKKIVCIYIYIHTLLAAYNEFSIKTQLQLPLFFFFHSVYNLKNFDTNSVYFQYAQYYILPTDKWTQEYTYHHKNPSSLQKTTVFGLRRRYLKERNE